MAAVSDALILRVSAALASELGCVEDVEARLVGHIRDGSSAHPSLVVETEAWVAYYARHLREGDALAQLSELRAADVHFVLACLGGSRAAHGQLAARLRGVSRQALAGIALGSMSVDELLAHVLAKLLVAERGEAKLASYAGRGPLDGWLRVTVARAGLSARRARDPDAARSYDDAELARLAANDDPRLAALSARCGPAIRRAVEEAAAALPAADRTLLRLHVIDALTIDDLAVVYKAHRATMARRLARSRSAIVEGTRARVLVALGLEESEFASLMGVMMSRLDLTLGSLLARSPPPEST